ncbi:MAG TPA: hypothetical protein VGJ28_23185 [Micromonosporaceae bacterium]|jgi:hypothetical protein
MTDTEPRIEDLGDHRFLVSLSDGDDLVEVQIVADPAVLELFGSGPADERRIIVAATAYLLERQHADDLPSRVDLDEVAAVYDDFVDDIRARIAGAGAPGAE